MGKELENADSEVEMSSKDKKRIIEQFLLNREVLSKLNPFLNEVNIFKILKSKEYELRHSNILAWLLDPKGSHGLGDVFTKLFISHVIKNNRQLDYDALKWSYIDLSECEVQREKHWKDTGTRDSLDILLTTYQADGHEYLIAIENKVRASEGKEQTKRYRKNIEEERPDAEKMFVYLSADNNPPSDAQWASLSYDSIIEMLDHLIQIYHPSQEVGLIIKNYRKVCAEIMDQDDKELREAVKKIYREHKDAIDLIIQYKPDLQRDIALYIVDKIKQLHKDENVSQQSESGTHPTKSIKPILNDQKRYYSYIRFNTPAMSQYIVPMQGNKLTCWNSKDNYYYQFSFQNKSGKLLVSFTLLLNVKNLLPGDEVYKRGNEIYEITDYVERNKEKQGFRVAMKPIQSDEFSLDDLVLDSIKSKLDQYFERVMNIVYELESKLPKDKIV